MIITKIRDWVPTNGLVHTSTIWELALDENFETITYTKEDGINLSFFQYDIDVPVDATYFLRQRKIMNNGESEIVSQTIEIKGTETNRENVILPRDMYIEHPTVYVVEDDLKNEDTIRVSTSEFKSNDGYHAYTHWIVLDALGKVLYCSLYDKDNLTSIEVPNPGQEYITKSKLIFRAIHGTNLGIESKPGNHTIINNNVNFEIVTNLNNVTAYKDLVIKFKKISNRLRLGIYSIDVYYGNTLSASKQFFTDDDTVTINWWLLKHGSQVMMHIKCVDVYDNLITIKKRITVGSFENELIKNESYQYRKMIDSWANSDPVSSPDFFIPNGFYSEPLHNGYIPMVKKNSNELHYYTLRDDNVLEYTGTFKGIILPTDDDMKEGMHIRRLNQEMAIISRLAYKDSGEKVHQLDFYKYNIEDDNYILFKELQIDGEEYALGWTNAIVQTAKSKIYYIPYMTDKIKTIDLDSFIVETVCDDIPIITPQKTNEITGEKSKVVSPIMTYLGDGRILISGGFSSTSVTFDYYNNTFQQSINWEYDSYTGNQLTSSFLNNGDSLILLTEKEERGIGESQDNLNQNEEIKVDKDLETIFKEVNADKSMATTRFLVEQSKYIVKLGDDFSVDFISNFGSMDPDQILVIYDKDTFRLDTKDVLGLKIRALARAATGKYKIKIITSKAQSFDQESYLPKLDFTHTVVTVDLDIELISDVIVNPDTTVDETGSLGQNTTNSERENLVILGKTYNYKSEDLTLKCYREDEIIIPFETVNCVVDDLEFDYTDVLAGKGEIVFGKLNTNMGVIRIKNYKMEDVITIGIYHRLRHSLFINVIVSFLDIPESGLPIKPAIIENEKELPNMSVLTYTELARYNFVTDEQTVKPEFIVNRSELGNVITTSRPFYYMFSTKKKGHTYLYMTSEKYPNEIYSNRFYLINNVDIVPTIDMGNPGLELKTLSTTTISITNDLSGYNDPTGDRGYEIFLEQSESSKVLVLITQKGKNFILGTSEKTGTGSFKIGIRNKADGITKISTFNYTIYSDDIFPSGLKCTFETSSNGLNGETIWVTPGSENPYVYTKTGNKVTMELDQDSIFDVTRSQESLTNDFDPKLYLRSDIDNGNSNMVFTFYNGANKKIISLTKHIKMVPVVFYVNDRFDGVVVANNFNYIVTGGEYTEYKIKPKLEDKYSLTSVKLVPIDNTDTTNLKYSLRQSGDADSNEYNLKIETPVSKEEKIYKFRIQYTYINDNGNLIASLTDDDYQTITIKSVYYKREAYLHIMENNFTMYVGDTKQIKLLTNGDKIKYTLGETDMLELDEIAGTITALKPGRATVIIQAGSEEQVPEQDVLFVTIEDTKETPEINQGYLDCTPNPIAIYIGLRMSLSIQTDGDGYSVTSMNRSVAIYDNITKQVIATGIGTTELKITYWGENIAGGTVYVPVEIKDVPTDDPSVLYFDSFNHTIVKTNIIFTNRTFPRSILRDASGKVVLSRYRLKKEDDETSGYETVYTVFY